MNCKEKQKERIKKEIIEMVEQIEKISMLEYLHTFIELFLKKWG